MRYCFSTLILCIAFCFLAFNQSLGPLPKTLRDFCDEAPIIVHARILTCAPRAIKKTHTPRAIKKDQGFYAVVHDCNVEIITVFKKQPFFCEKTARMPRFLGRDNPPSLAFRREKMAGASLSLSIC